MATWDITTRAGSWVVTYRRRSTTVLGEDIPGAEFPCGATPQAESSLGEVVDWLTDEVDPGDIVQYAGTLLFQKLLPSEA